MAGGAAQASWLKRRRGRRRPAAASCHGAWTTLWRAADRRGGTRLCLTPVGSPAGRAARPARNSAAVGRVGWMDTDARCMCFCQRCFVTCRRICSQFRSLVNLQICSLFRLSCASRISFSMIPPSHTPSAGPAWPGTMFPAAASPSAVVRQRHTLGGRVSHIRTREPIAAVRRRGPQRPEQIPPRVVPDVVYQPLLPISRSNRRRHRTDSSSTQARRTQGRASSSTMEAARLPRPM